MKIVVAALLVFMVSVSLVSAQTDEDNVEQALDTARRYLTHGNYAKAAQYAENVLRMSPGNSVATDILTEVRKHSGDVIHERRSFPVSSGEASEAELLGQWREATDEGVKHELAVRLSDLYLNKAQALERNGASWKKVVIRILLNLRKAIALNNENAWAHYELFTQLCKLNRLEESIPHARKFLAVQGFGVVVAEVRKKLQEVYVAIGDRYERESRWNKAAKFYRGVLGLNPEEEILEDVRNKLALAYLTLFFKLHERRQYAEAAGYLDGLLSLRPESGEARTAFDGDYWRRVRRYAPTVFWEAVKVLKERKKYDKALAYIGRLLQCGPSTALRKKALEMKDKIVEEQVVLETESTVATTAGNTGEGQ